jgi:hypothetical protein
MNQSAHRPPAAVTIATNVMIQRAGSMIELLGGDGATARVPGGRRRGRNYNEIFARLSVAARVPNDGARLDRGIAADQKKPAM